MMHIDAINHIHTILEYLFYFWKGFVALIEQI